MSGIEGEGVCWALAFKLACQLVMYLEKDFRDKQKRAVACFMSLPFEWIASLIMALSAFGVTPANSHAYLKYLCGTPSLGIDIAYSEILPVSKLGCCPLHHAQNPEP